MIAGESGNLGRVVRKKSTGRRARVTTAIRV